jgi:hypothetical protein
MGVACEGKGGEWWCWRRGVMDGGFLGRGLRDRWVVILSIVVV